MKCVPLSVFVLCLVGIACALPPQVDQPPPPPPPLSALNTDQVCKDNEEYRSCGEACPETCETLLSQDKPRMCPMNCVPGCFCKSDFVRNKQNQCVHTFECAQPRDPSASEFANGNAAWTTTGVAFPVYLLVTLAIVLFA